MLRTMIGSSRARSVLLGVTAAVALSAVTLCSPALAKDYYVSANRGRGKKATKKKPAKDLGNIISKLQPGDTVHIAEGTYLGRGENGSNTIDVPVSIIGGYSDDFSKRDPWGAHKTILSGNNLTQNYTPQPALKIDLMKSHFKNIQGCEFVIDGLIIDHGARNRYQTDKQAKLLLKADPKTGKNPSPSLGGLVIWLNKSGKFDEGPPWKVTVQNCIILNTHQNQGALAVSGFRQSTITIRNNAVINHSGHGFQRLLLRIIRHRATLQSSRQRGALATASLLQHWSGLGRHNDIFHSRYIYHCPPGAYHPQRLMHLLRDIVRYKSCNALQHARDDSGSCNQVSVHRQSCVYALFQGVKAHLLDTRQCTENPRTSDTARRQR